MSKGSKCSAHLRRTANARLIARNSKFRLIASPARHQHWAAASVHHLQAASLFHRTLPRLTYSSAGRMVGAGLCQCSEGAKWTVDTPRAERPNQSRQPVDNYTPRPVQTTSRHLYTLSNLVSPHRLARSAQPKGRCMTQLRRRASRGAPAGTAAVCQPGHTATLSALRGGWPAPFVFSANIIDIDPTSCTRATAEKRNLYDIAKVFHAKPSL